MYASIEERSGIMLSASVQCVGALTLISAGVILLLVGRCLTVAAL